MNFNQNLSLAKAEQATFIYNLARLEQVPVTNEQVETIVAGKSVSNLRIDDLQKVLNLYYAWNYMINNIHAPFSLEFTKKINGYVAYNESVEWGVIRSGTVGITGVNYRPSVPVEQDIWSSINDVINNQNSSRSVLKFMLWTMRSQLFWDGNKRTSIISVNKLLIQHGNGLLSVPESSLTDFHLMLTNYYETADDSKLITYLYDNCIHLYDN
ncbi:filamentation induced by cAMP protein fic [Halobacillus rhizosphaerae]|uniref:filamentation induced by cAMP protein fic n=1 Tax=Halobacillus rhizosphaerae TaxID=3064889 RepID=UPI00398AC433